MEKMEDLFKLIEFRPFAFDSDLEFVVDMHRAGETLEGSWFDTESTLRMYHKMVLRANGSSWVLAFNRAIVGWADLIGRGKIGHVIRWRIHPDYRQNPKISKMLLDNLKIVARKREMESLNLFADSGEVIEDLESIGEKRDRAYQWVTLHDVDPLHGAEVTYIKKSLHEALAEEYINFLGPPFPPQFIVSRSFLAFEYGAFYFRNPEFYLIHVGDVPYHILFDGREWFVFRKQKSPSDADSVKRILSVIASFGSGRILLSEKAIEKAEVVPASDEVLWDFHFTL
jgi:hypothetical protein